MKIGKQKASDFIYDQEKCTADITDLFASSCPERYLI